MDPIISGTLANLGINLIERFLPAGSPQKSSEVTFAKFLENPEELNLQRVGIAEELENIKNSILKDPQWKYFTDNNPELKDYKIEISSDSRVIIRNDLGEPLFQPEGELKENLLKIHSLSLLHAGMNPESLETLQQQNNLLDSMISHKTWDLTDLIS